MNGFDWLSGGFFGLSKPNEPKNEPTSLLILKGLLGSFCKKNFFLPLLSPRKLNKANSTNALRPDSPSRKFRGQQNYSENSENSENSEDPEDPEETES